MDNTRLTITPEKLTTAFNLHRDPVPAFCTALARGAQSQKADIPDALFEDLVSGW